MSCEIDGCNEVERTTYPRARKEHCCDACRQTIRIGDRYARIFVIWDREPAVWIHCARCNLLFGRIAGRHRELQTGEGVQFDLDCGHSWQEIFDEPPPDDVARLAFLTQDEAQQEFSAQ